MYSQNVEVQSLGFCSGIWQVLCYYKNCKRWKMMPTSLLHTITNFSSFRADTHKYMHKYNALHGQKQFQEARCELSFGQCVLSLTIFSSKMKYGCKFSQLPVVLFKNTSTSIVSAVTLVDPIPATENTLSEGMEVVGNA